MEKTLYVIGSIASLEVIVYVLFLFYLAYKQHKTLITWYGQEKANEVKQKQKEEVNTEKRKKTYKFSCKWLQIDTKYLLWRIRTINKEHFFYTERTMMIDRGLKAAINRFLNKNAEFLGGTDKEPTKGFYFASDKLDYQMIKQIVKENK